jgi:hypothetical protein
MQRGKRYAYKFWVGKPEGKKPHGRPRHIRKENITIDLIEQC